MSNPTVVEYCECAVPKIVFDNETDQSICTQCGGVLKYGSERVIVNMAMVRIGNVVLELVELNKVQSKLIDDLIKLMQDWADVLTPPSEED